MSEQERHNYSHFHPRTLGRDAKLVMQSRGPLPGEPAPDFTLSDIEGRNWTLSELRGKPVVLIFGSGTCPMTTGSLPGLNKLYQEKGDTAQWLMVYVREAHPGENMPAHESLEQKRRRAQRMRDEEGIGWPVLIGELDGSTHQAYTELPNHIFLIDREGNVAFRGEFAHAPSLYEALTQLEAQDGVGPVSLRVDRSMHMLGATAFGWRGPQRGGVISKRDIVKRAPPLAANLKMGEMMQPLLAPLAARSRPLHQPLSGKGVFWSGLIAGAVFMMLEMIMVMAFLGNTPWGPPRMIAAMVMGRDVLPPPATFTLTIIMVAMAVHFTLSWVYAFLFAWVFGGIKIGTAIIIGAVLGLVVYLINFYDLLLSGRGSPRREIG